MDFQPFEILLLRQLQYCNAYDNYNQSMANTDAYLNETKPYLDTNSSTNTNNYDNQSNTQYENDNEFDSLIQTSLWLQAYNDEMSQSDGKSSTSSVEISTDLQTLEQFAVIFKQRRIRLGYTQANVGALLAQWNNGVDFSQTTICRFENLQLSFKNANSLIPLLKHWLEQAVENVSHENITNLKIRKRRSSISLIQKDSLECHFEHQNKPSPLELSTLAESMSLEKEGIRVWFCNRRQKEKRIKSSRTKPAMEKTELTLRGTSSNPNLFPNSLYSTENNFIYL